MAENIVVRNVRMCLYITRSSPRLEACCYDLGCYAIYVLISSLRGSHNVSYGRTWDNSRLPSKWERGCEYLFITTEGRSRMKQKTLGRERLRSSLQFAARSWTPACSLLPRREMCTPCAPVTLPLRLRLRSCVLPAALVIAEVKKLCKVQVFACECAGSYSITDLNEKRYIKGFQ